MKRQVSEQHEITQGSPEKVREMKIALDAMLTKELPATVEKELGKDALWLFRPGFTDPGQGRIYLMNYSVHERENRGPDAIDNAIRAVIMKTAGAFLKKHGYKLWKASHSATESYPDSFGWPRPLYEKLKPYADAVRAFQEAVEQLKSEKDRKQRAIAADIWDRS